MLAKDDGGRATSILPRRKSLVAEEPEVAVLAKFGREILGGIAFLGGGRGPALLGRGLLLRGGGGGWSLGIGFSTDFRAVFAEEQTKILSDGQSALDLGDILHGLYPVSLGLGGGDGLLHLAQRVGVLDAVGPALAGLAVQDAQEPELGRGVDLFLLEKGDDAIHTLLGVASGRDGAVHDVLKGDELRHGLGREAGKTVQRAGV